MENVIIASSTPQSRSTELEETAARRLTRSLLDAKVLKNVFRVTQSVQQGSVQVFAAYLLKMTL